MGTIAGFFRGNPSNPRSSASHFCLSPRAVRVGRARRTPSRRPGRPAGSRGPQYREPFCKGLSMFVQLTREYLGKPPGERIDVSDADARHLVESGVAVAVADDPIGPAVGRAFENALGRFSTALNGAFDNALRQFVEAQGHSRRHASPLIFGESGGDPRGKSFGDWLLCVRHNNAKRLADVYDSRLAEWVEGKAAMSTTGGTVGGYTVPTEFLPRLLLAAAEQAVVRPRATVGPMAARSSQVPYLDVTNAPTAGDTAFFGAVVARWSEEASTLNETEPIFRQIELVAHELSGYSLISNTLLADNAI